MLKLRLFFALWPDDPVRRAAANAARVPLAPCRGKPMAVPNYHITLAFLGDVPADRIDCLYHLAEGLRGEPFELRLDTFGFFERARVVWLGPSEEPPALADFQARLNQALPRCDLVPEGRPYHPHLTLLRNARRGPDVTTTAPIPWSVKDFALVRSVPAEEGSGYQVLRRWPLTSNEGRGSRSEEEKTLPPRT
jgi:2'-5' RNA ligase